ncbi:ABC transporter permease [Bradyrhizobium sp.]|uniref:ABC transporter permease n=1 Tax=Bradyrhizobium sp. TaxID=376 RepID=UPI003C51D4A9
MKNWRAWVLPAVGIAASELLIRLTVSDSDILVPPSKVAVAGMVAIADGSLLRATFETLAAALAGLTLGAGAGMVCGILLGMSRTAFHLSFLAIEILRPIPAVALIPLAMLIFGFGFGMEISVVAIAILWPVLVLSQRAVANVPAVLLEVGRLLCLGRLKILISIILPAAAPELFTAFRFAAAYALVVAVTIEIFANPQGLGYALIVSQQMLHPETMLAMLFWVGVIGWGMNFVCLQFQRTFFVGWNDTAQGPS